MTVFSLEDVKERRFVPWEMKENVFKHVMGYMGVSVINYACYPLGIWGSLACSGFVLNGMFRSWQIMSSTVRKMELHKDGKTVTLYPTLTSQFDA